MLEVEVGYMVNKFQSRHDTSREQKWPKDQHSWHEIHSNLLVPVTLMELAYRSFSSNILGFDARKTQIIVKPKSSWP